MLPFQGTRFHNQSDVANQAGQQSITGDLNASGDVQIGYAQSINLAYSLHRSSLTSSQLLRDVQSELAALIAVMQIIQENPALQRLPELRDISAECFSALADLQRLKHNHDVNVTKPVAPSRLAKSKRELDTIKAQLRRYIDALHLLNSHAVLSSQEDIQNLLQNYLEEVRKGKRRHSILSNQSKRASLLSIDELSVDSDFEAWHQVRTELEDVGITPKLFIQHQSFILQELQKAIEAAGLAEDFGLLPKNNADQVESDDDVAVSPDEKLQTQHADEILSNDQFEVDASIAAVANNPNSAPTSDDELIAAATIGDDTAVAQYLVAGAYIYQTDSFGRNALMCAARGGHVGCTQLLMMLPSTRNSVDAQGKTALFYACEHGRADVVRELLSHPNVDAKICDSRGRSPALMAVLAGHREVVSILAAQPESHVDLYQTDHLGRTPLLVAVTHNRTDIAMVLLSSGKIVGYAKCDQRGRTVLSHAAGNNMLDVVQKLLLYLDVDMNVPDRSGMTPLHYAVSARKRRNVAFMLLSDFCISVNDETVGKKLTPLMLAAQNRHDESLCLRLVRHPDMAVNNTDSSGDTALHMAIVHHNIYMARLLITHPATDVNLPNNVGVRPLSLALRLSRFDIVEELLNRSDSTFTKRECDASIVSITALKCSIVIKRKLLVKMGSSAL